MTAVASFVFTHQHLIIDAELKEKLNFSRRHETVVELIKKLLHELSMEKLAPLQIFDATDAQYPGWSFIQPITTSHISGHYFEEANTLSHIHMDIYSCKEYEWKNVFPILNNELNLDQWAANLIIRSPKLVKQTHILISGKGSTIKKIRKML